MRSFLNLLDNTSVRKISNPEEIRKIDKKRYEIYEEDAILAYLLCEWNFKGIVTEDGRFALRIPKDKVILSYSDLTK